MKRRCVSARGATPEAGPGGVAVIRKEGKFSNKVDMKDLLPVSAKPAVS